MEDFDIDLVDSEIKPIVELLNSNGYETFTSCQGGEGHSFNKPTVGVLFKGDYFEFKKKFVEFLKPNFSHFSLNLRTYYGTSKEHSEKRPCWTALYLELRSLNHFKPNKKSVDAIAIDLNKETKNDIQSN